MRSITFMKKMLKQRSWGIPHFGHSHIVGIPPHCIEHSDDPDELLHQMTFVMILCQRPYSVFVPTWSCICIRGVITGRVSLAWPCLGLQGEAVLPQCSKKPGIPCEAMVRRPSFDCCNGWKLGADVGAAWAWLRGKNSSRNMLTTFLPLSFRQRAVLTGLAGLVTFLMSIGSLHVIAQ